MSTANYLYQSGTNRVTELRDGSSSLLRDLDYDAAGNITDDTTTAGSAYDYNYDADGRLDAITNGSGALASYAYDARGRRIFRATFGGGASTRLYVFDQNNMPLAETDGAGAIVREYIWLEGGLVGMTTGSGASSTLHFVHGGHLGQPIRMTSSSKAIVWDIDQEPFGKVSTLVGTVPQDARFPGQWEQYEAGLFQNLWRDYDPTLGRYIQPDPIGLNGGTNVYGYAYQDPANRVDKNGLDFIVLYAPGAPMGFGHVGALIGNDAAGYEYFSKDRWGGLGKPATQGRGHFDSLDDFMKSPDPNGKGLLGDRFTEAFRFQRDDPSDARARASMDRDIATPYYLLPNTANCLDAVTAAMIAAGLRAPSLDYSPAEFYDALRTAHWATARYGGKPYGGRPDYERSTPVPKNYTPVYNSWPR